MNAPTQIDLILVIPIFIVSSMLASERIDKATANIMTSVITCQTPTFNTVEKIDVRIFGA